ncbi:hypothetical protein HPB48_012702 [Haemaphysalis longicornis]|uniref:Transmembrane protein n=1 Tax=Haemaphysalis longicornis TaxID=44386 RepID=A0A9J6G1J6_HAELO|nr:hypothetical protein HPB48_012702 [Haemaphysalis longicornis]
MRHYPERRRWREREATRMEASLNGVFLLPDERSRSVVLSCCVVALLTGVIGGSQSLAWSRPPSARTDAGPVVSFEADRRSFNSRQVAPHPPLQRYRCDGVLFAISFLVSLSCNDENEENRGTQIVFEDGSRCAKRNQARGSEAAGATRASERWPLSPSQANEVRRF